MNSPIKKLPAPTQSFMEEIGVKSERTQIKTTTHIVFEKLVKEYLLRENKTPVIVDIGAGKGLNVKNLESQNIPVIAIEPFANPKVWINRKPDYRYSTEAPSEIANLIFNSYVLNVVPPDIAEVILKDIYRILKPKGQALIFVRNINDVETNCKAYLHPEHGELSWGKGHKVTSNLTYQRGFTYKSLSELICSCCSFSNIERFSTKSGLAVLVTK